MSTLNEPVPGTRIRRLVRSYAVGVAVLAVVSIAASTIIVRQAGRQRNATRHSNLAGRQRLLTQRLATEAFALVARAPASDDRFAAARAAALQWHLGFDRLRHGSVGADLSPPLASDLRALDSMRPTIERLDARLVALFASPARAAIADSVKASADALTAQLDAYLAELDARHRRHVQLTQRLGIGFAVLLISLLGLEALLVFRPAIGALGSLMLDQEAIKVELYAKAEEMYAVTVQQEMQNDMLQSQQQTMLEQQEELMAQQATLIEQRDHLEARTTDLSRLTAILDATPDAVAVFSLTGDVLYANAAAELHLTQVRKRDWTHAAHLLTPASVRQLRDVAFPGAIRRGLWRGEATLRMRDGQVRTVVQTLIAHRAPDGRVATVSSLLQDITEQKSLQRKLAQDEARNRSIVEALAEGVIVQDDVGRIIQWNKGAERILGLSADQLTGRTSIDGSWRSIDALGQPLPGERHPISRSRLEGLSIDGEVMGIERGDGTRAWLSVNARPMPNGGQPGMPTAVATFTDITASVAVARELETLSVVARQSDHAIVMLDRAGMITWVNTAWETLAGYTLSEVQGRSPADFLHGTHTRPEVMAGIGNAIVAGERWNGEILHYRRDGAPYWIELNLTPSCDGSGTCTGFVGLARDITARRTADRERQQLAAAVAVTADGIAITGVSGALEFVNHAFARMHGHSATELLQTPWAALYEPEESRRLVRDAIPEVTQVGFWHGEATGRRQDGSLYPQELSLTLLPHGGLVAVARDISERKAGEERLKHISVRDELTSLYNRRGFLERADAMLRLSARQGMRCALFYGDLDAFKSVNDGFGHNAGDAALKAVSEILTATFRETDLVARIGGDEFTILAINVQPADVSLISERIEAAVAASNADRRDDSANAWHLGISLGVAYFDPEAPEDVEALLRTADARQYEQKRQRKAQHAQAA